MVTLTYFQVALDVYGNFVTNSNHCGPFSPSHSSCSSLSTLLYKF